MSNIKKADTLNPEDCDWDALDEKVLAKIRTTAQHWGRRFNVDPDDLEQESVLYLLARPGRSVWWGVKTVADQMRGKATNEADTFEELTEEML